MFHVKHSRRNVLNFTDFKKDCKDIFALNSLPVQPSDKQIEKLFELTEIMLEVNESMNLTAITEQKAIILKHYVDSVTVCADIPQNTRLIDIGCGAGFPSLPLAIFRPDVAITSLDSTAKRIGYVAKTAQKLGLDNITAIAGRAEEYANKSNFRESFDVATARAVAAMPALSELCLPFVKKDGLFLAMKASRGEQEADEAKNAIALCGGKLEELRRVELTLDGEAFESRAIIKVKKIAQTPAKYPRHYSQISKKPL